MTPSASSRSTRRLTAGADSETRSPMLWNERRASWRSSATICRSMSSIRGSLSHGAQRIALERRARQRNHEADDFRYEGGLDMSTQPVAAPRERGAEDFMPL